MTENKRLFSFPFLFPESAAYMDAAKKPVSMNKQAQGQAATHKLLRGLCLGSRSFPASEEQVLYVCRVCGVQDGDML